MRIFFQNKKCYLCLFPLLLLIFFLVSIASAQDNLNLNYFSCTPVQVSDYKDYSVSNISYTGRVSVQCNPPFNQYKYFAVPLTDPAEAARFLSLFTAAFVAGKTINIGYLNGDTSGNAFNCTSTTSCYPAVSATIR